MRYRLPFLALLLVTLTPSMASQQTQCGCLTVTGGSIFIPVNPCLSLVKQNVAMSCMLSASGGTNTGFVWSTTGGPGFPTGISDITAGGVIAGTPTVSTTGFRIVTVKDSQNNPGVATVTITPATLTGTGPCGSASCVTPTGRTIGINQSITFQAITYWSDSTTLDVSSRGAWSCTNGTATCGTFSGSIYTAGASAGTVTVKNTFNGVTDDGGSGITLTTINTTPAIQTASPLCPGQINQPYSEKSASQCIESVGLGAGVQFTATGGTPPYAWTCTVTCSTVLPAGVTLSSGGLLSGTPTASGTFPWTVKVTDNVSNTSTAPMSVTIASQTSVTVTPASPSMNVGATLQMTATANFSDSPPTVNVTQGNTISPVGSVGCGNASATSTTSITCPAINLPAGVLLIGQMSCSATAGTFAASDTATNTVVFPNSSVLGPASGSYFKSSVFYVLNTAANSADVFTLSNGATSCAYWAGNLAWYSIPSPTLDQHPAGETNASSSALSNQTNSGSITTTSANEIIVQGAVDGSTNRTLSTVSPLTLRVAQSGGQSALGDQIVSAIQTAQSYSMQFSGAADNHISQTLTFAAGSGSGATWTITAGNCTVTATGLVTANGGTSCTVQASYGGQNGSQTVTINSPVLQSIAVTPSPAGATAGGPTLQMTATGTYSSGPTQNITNSVLWSSSNTSIATISASGVVTPVASGSSTITAASGSINGTSPLTVSPAGALGTIYYQTNFETSGSPCSLTTISGFSTVNPANSMSDIRLSTDPANGVHGHAFSGNCSALDPKALPTPDGFGDYEAKISGNPTQIWASWRFYVSNTWTAKSQAHQGALHMWRFLANTGTNIGSSAAGPYFALGEASALANNMEIVAVCSIDSSGNCTNGSTTNDTGGESSVQLPSIAGSWHCGEAFMGLPTPGQANGFIQWYMDGTRYVNMGTSNGGNGSWTFTTVNLGSNVGGGSGASTWDIANKWIYTDDMIISQFRNTNCAVAPTHP